ncbi:hypothetical protein DI005_16540 [Prauserella sp. PE36]|uniref:Glycosyltransferase RgtA/B/C/D-like domain-containing protein n=1 Tax=Prauserella endophytica TaxID=1592324 RepID=A0ABY2SC43_9PSEU|nr:MULTISPECIES: hypothetical protein [Prauserella]RBM19289.1 hypothetical protein DI005_16540 [Prauserella sp. PE36]TKG73462.1 hypothetical protein FCN18_02515 [Prauserella endophytica]
MVAVAAGLWLALGIFVVAGWSRVNTDRVWRAAALLLALAFALAHQLLFATIAEDAYLTFRYARNVADGYGPVFNPGERVEGYSNFLWMVLIALPRAMFGADVEPAAPALGIACALGCVLAVYFLVNRIVRLAEGEGGGGLPALGVAAAVVTAGASSLAGYGPSGLETPLFLLLTLCVVHALAAGRPVVAGVLVALTVMTRPEGLVLAVLAGAWLLLVALRSGTTKWAPAGYVLGALVLLVPWTAWRVTYYGHLLPNSLVASSGGSVGSMLRRGWDYLAGFALAYQVFLLLAVAAIAFLLSRRSLPRARSLAWLVLAVAVAFAGYAVAVGGDRLPSWRLLAPVPPLLAVFAAAAYGLFLVSRPSTVPSPQPRAERLAGRRTVPVVAVAVCGLSLVVSTTHPGMVAGMHDWRASIRQLAETGTWLGERLPPGTVVSTYANGALSYRAGPQLVVVDVLGLTDEHIARQGERIQAAGIGGQVASDYDYVVNVRMPSVAVDTAEGYTERQHCGINPAYAGLYEVATFRREGQRKWVSLYVRSAQAPALIPLLDADPRFDYVRCG